jgi:ketosteroid isomerase-like protein
MTATTDSSIAAELVGALAAQDYDRLETLFAPDVRFRALVPKGLREDATAAAAAARVRGWFGECHPLELVDSEIGHVADRVHARYLFRAREEGQWHLVEQHAYLEVEDGRISDISILCSGFRVVD